jgi:hypothetical protein
MTKIGLLSNRGSRQNKRGLSEIDAAAQASGVIHRQLSDMADLGRVLTDFADRGVEVVAVNGGDGTVQAVLTDLLERRPFAKPPALALLSGGTTNMTAADVGLHGRPAQALARLVRSAEQRKLGRCLVKRHALRLQNVPGFPPQRGMFFGASGIYRAIEYCHAKVHPLQARADWAAGLTLLGLFFGRVFGGDASHVFTGETVTVSFDNGPACTGERLLVLATTLDRLLLGSRPYWNQHGGPVRFTALADPPKRLLRWAPRVMYGGNERKLPADGYMSRAAHQVHLELEGRFTLDGQLFDPPTDGPLVITAPEPVDFVRC